MRKGLYLFLVVSLVAFAGIVEAQSTVTVVNECAMGAGSGTQCSGGPCGLRVDIDGTDAYVQDDSSNSNSSLSAEKVYRAQFWIDPNNLSLANVADRVVVLFGKCGSANADFPNGASVRIEMINKNGKYRIIGKVKNNGGAWIKTASPVSWLVLGTVPREVQLEFVAEQSSAGGGTIRLTRLDTSVFVEKTAVNNGKRDVDLVRFGAAKDVAAMAPTAAGYMCVDEFASFRTLAP